MSDREIVFVLRMETPDLLESAFALILDASAVSSCIIEPDHEQIRFVAPEDEASEIIDHIYALGGLVWTSRHELTSDSPMSG